MSLQICPQCSAEIVGRFHFCLECGAPLELAKALTPLPQGIDVSPPSAQSVPQQRSSRPAPQLAQPSPAPREPSLSSRANAAQHDYLDLTLIRSPDLDSVRFVVRNQSAIGREEGHLIFRDDPYISPLHAILFYHEGELYIRDEGSLNGIYVRITEPTPLTPGETFIAGEQVFTLQNNVSALNHPIIEQLSQTSETQFFANSPRIQSQLFLSQRLEGGKVGAIYPFIESSITIGRQGCDINAPLDRFMSSKHCHVGLMMNQEVTLTDTGSKNGTYVKIHGERKLSVGDYILIGKQLLQVQPHQPGSSSKIAI